MKPLAVKIYWLFLNGASVEELAEELNVPPEQVVRRIVAAAALVDRCDAEAKIQARP